MVVLRSPVSGSAALTVGPLPPPCAKSGIVEVGVSAAQPERNRIERIRAAPEWRAETGREVVIWDSREGSSETAISVVRTGGRTCAARTSAHHPHSAGNPPSSRDLHSGDCAGGRVAPRPTLLPAAGSPGSRRTARQRPP